MVGGIGWTDWETINHSEWGLSIWSANIEYWLVKSAVNQGIVTRSARALIDYGFQQIGLNRITIRAEPENKRSWAVPELGFQYAVTIRHVCRWKDRWVAHRIYAMLADEWSKRYFETDDLTP